MLAVDECLLKAVDVVGRTEAAGAEDAFEEVLLVVLPLVAGTALQPDDVPGRRRPSELLGPAQLGLWDPGDLVIFPLDPSQPGSLLEDPGVQETDRLPGLSTGNGGSTRRTWSGDRGPYTSYCNSRSAASRCAACSEKPAPRLPFAALSHTDQSSSPEPSRTLNRPTMTPGCHTFESMFWLSALVQ